VPRKRKLKVVEHGFRLADGQLEIPHGRQLRDSPLDLLNAFAIAQQYDAPLTRKARRLIRENLYVIDDRYRSDPAAVAIFERILNAENRVMRTLMVMNEEDVLAAFIPEWRQIVCRWQHIMYHTYTVDVHTIFLVEQLRRLWKGEYEDFVPGLTEMIRLHPDRPVVFMGCLLHDIGKGLGGNHSVKGADFARTVVERLGFSKERADRVVFLVEHHLLMSHLAQSRDLTDAKLIVDFARTVGNRGNLRDLYLVTFADIRASSNTAWTEWKGQLLRELFERTSEFIETGGDDENRAVEIIEARVETRRAAALAEMAKLGVPEADVLAYFEAMPRRYFMSHAPRQIARHANVVLGFSSEKKFSTAVREMRGEFSEFILCTRDVHGLYSRVAGVLAAHGINILASNVYTTRSGLALEVYRVSTPAGGENERSLAWRDFERSLETALVDASQVDRLIANRGRRVTRKLRGTRKVPAVVRITNDESDFYTIVDVKVNDRIGLLHALTKVIADLGLEIYISKAGTVLDQVQDTFYLKDAEGRKIVDAAALEELRARMLRAAQGDDDAA
jgi:[protein-PII] uridylyltransferase